MRHRHPFEQPMVRGRPAYAQGESGRVVGAQEDARWGYQGVIQFNTGITPTGTPPNQLIRAFAPRPQVWGVFLIGNLVTGVQGAGNVQFQWAISLGVGQGVATFNYTFRWDGTLAAPAEVYNQLASPFPQIFKELELPAKEIQIVGNAFEQGLAPQEVVVDVGVYVAPRTLVY